MAGLKVPKTTRKTEIKVTLNIKPGPASPAQKAAWRRFWRNLLAEAKDRDAASDKVHEGEEEQDEQPYR